jgi:hypothetical protein
MAEIKSVEILRVRVDFATRFQACVAVESRSTDVLDRERDLIQLFILTWVKLLLLLGPNKQAGMLVDYFQRVMGDTVTPKGLLRPVIMSGEQKLLEAPPEIIERTATFRLIQEEDGRLVEADLPPADEGHLYPACAIFMLQYLIREFGEPSLFFLMLVMGGVMEYYEKIGKTDDLKALTAAPAYGFSVAMRYIDDERKKNELLGPDGNPASPTQNGH